ncbi:MAG: hypothetical protein GY765_29710, partial [bacterium]|nr:hypothetical protein [bacterium]
MKNRNNAITLKSLVLTILTLVPLIYLIWVVGYCYVDIPFADQWDFVPLLEKSFQGGVTYTDLMAQHNEHRLFFPRIIMLGLAHLSDWDISHELILNVVLGIALFLVLVSRVRATQRETGKKHLAWALPLISLIVFSLNQWENWVWGWQIQIFLCVAAIVSGILLLSGPVFKWWKLAVAAGFGIIAVFSFANGFSYLLICAGILLVNPGGNDKKKKYLALTYWCTTSVAIAFVYFYNYSRPLHTGDTSGIMGVLSNPLEYAAFVLKFLGSPLTEFNRNALALGFL